MTQLHRPGDARWLPWRPPFLPAIADDGDRPFYHSLRVADGIGLEPAVI